MITRFEQYNWNVGRWAQEQMPTFEKYQAWAVFWIWSLLWPLQQAHFAWQRWAFEQRILCRLSSQTALLKWYLNRVYDPVLQRFQIINLSLNNPAASPQFRVTCPPDASTDVRQAVERLVQRYALIDRDFEIV